MERRSRSSTIEDIEVFVDISSREFDDMLDDDQSADIPDVSSLGEDRKFVCYHRKIITCGQNSRLNEMRLQSR